MKALAVGERIRYMRKGLVHHGEVIKIEPNQPFSDVIYTVRTDEHAGQCVLVTPKAIQNALPDSIR